MTSLDHIVSWYQKKIGTYDKQQWEKTIEQRIFNGNGIVNFPLKNTKLKTDLIDVDLVRGSSFPKAKPKQNLLTVIKLAASRYYLLPLYARWWVEQTTPKIFIFLLFLYLLQMINWAVYSYNVQRINESTVSTKEIEHIVSITELLVPMALSLFLCTIHSQIVATSSIVSSSGKRSLLTKSKKRERTRRKKRSTTRIRSIDKKTILIADNLKTKLIQLNDNINEKSSSSSNTKSILNLAANCSKLYADTDDNGLQHDIQDEDISPDNKIPSASPSSSSCGLRKRNVNWDLSITQNKLKTDDTLKTANNSSTSMVGVSVVVHQRLTRQTGEDDGFESLNGRSSGEDNNNNNNSRNTVASSSPLLFPFSNNLRVRTLTTDSETDSLKCTTNRNRNNAYKSLDNNNGSITEESTITCTKKVHKSSVSCGGDSTDTDEEGDDGELVMQSASTNNLHHSNEVTASTAEWIGITTNSEDCSYNSSEIEHSASQYENSENGGEYELTPAVLLNPVGGTGDRINCTIWDGRETKKAEMSVLDISSAIIEKVEAMQETCDYIYIGCILSVLLSFVTVIGRLYEASGIDSEVNFLDVPTMILERAISNSTVIDVVFGNTTWENTVLMNCLILRISLTFVFFFLLAVAERTFKQKFLYAKLFSHLTSSRRAKKSEVPHFRLNKVRNIKTWLSVRSYLMRRGPQRSVDVIVSAAFILTLLLLAFLSVEWLKDSVQTHIQFNLEALLWACAISIFLLRFMTLGTKINRKYRSISVLITEQINLYLQIEQKPQKKEELSVANSVLKLAADLLKELDAPFKISGLNANPYLYTTVKVVILSALSGVLSEMLGFKLKLHKIKIK